MLRRFSERAFALPSVVILMVILSALAVAGIVLARNQQSMYARTNVRATAFYGAEAGLAAAIENWSGAKAATTPPGSTRVVFQGTLSGGMSYTAEVERLDDGSSVHPIFVLRARATSRTGYVDQVGLLATSIPLQIPIYAALRVRGDTNIRGGTEINGYDQVPPDMAAACPPAGDPLPGVLADDPSHVEVSGDAEVYGDPQVAVDPDTSTAHFFDFGDLTFEDLAASADIWLPDGAQLSGSRPSPTLTADGTCDMNDPYNWGDPNRLGEPCTDWFPLVYVDGDLDLAGNGSGQGILVVDGDLKINAGVEFYGPVFVTGELKSNGGGFHVHGGVVAGATEIDDPSMVAGSTTIAYSSCALQRALSHSNLAEPHALLERPWYQKR